MNKIKLVGLLGLASLLFAGEAWALTVTSPITVSNGNIACSTCLTGTVTQYGVALGGTGQATA